MALLAALILTAVWQVHILGPHPPWRDRLLPFLAAGVFASAAGLLGSRLLALRWAASASLRRASLAVGWLSVLLAPAVWSLMPVMAPGNPMIPVADPSLLTGTGGLAPPPMDLTEVLPLVNYLRAHSRAERYLLATSNLIVAASIVVETGEPVMATGGFLGTDPILTPARLAQMIGTGQVRFALVPIRTAAQPGGIGSRLSPGGRVINPALWRPDLVPADPAGPDFRPAQGPDHLVTSRDFDATPGRRISAVGLAAEADGAHRLQAA